MPKSSSAKLAWQKAYNKTPKQTAKRVANNKARRHAIKAGKTKVGDGKEVDHIKPLDAGGSTSDANTRVVSAKFNKQWRKREPKIYG